MYNMNQGTSIAKLSIKINFNESTNVELRIN